MDFPATYLQPERCAAPDIGRTWCQDNAPQACPDGNGWTKNVLAKDSEARIADLQDENHELQEGAADLDRLREHMNALLTQTANALKGNSKELKLHSWQDLPEIAEKLQRELETLKSNCPQL